MKKLVIKQARRLNIRLYVNSSWVITMDNQSYKLRFYPQSKYENIGSNCAQRFMNYPPVIPKLSNCQKLYTCCYVYYWYVYKNFKHNFIFSYARTKIVICLSTSTIRKINSRTAETLTCKTALQRRRSIRGLRNWFTRKNATKKDSARWKLRFIFFLS